MPSMLGSFGIRFSRSDILSSTGLPIYHKASLTGSQCGSSTSTSKRCLLFSDTHFDRCDEINLDGSKKGPDVQRSSYSHAMKMRAAATYGFGRISSCGNTPWQLDGHGQWRGNPSISLSVSRYMVSLRRRKVLVSHAWLILNKL
jgi:hypothetical protein